MTADVQHHPFVHHRSRRFHVTLLLMIGLFSMSLMTSTIGITLNCMINSTAIALDAQRVGVVNEQSFKDGLQENNSSTSCSRVEGREVQDYGGSYEWSVEMQGHIVGAAFLGGLVSTFPTGLAIDRFSIRHLLLVSMLLLSSATVLIPLFAEKFGPYAVAALRFLIGVGEGIMIPGMNGMITGWIPLHEKSTAASLFTSGNQLAGIFGSPIAAELCASTLRWPAVFLTSGLLGFLWCVVWNFTINNSPANSKWISDHEVMYLQHHLPENQLKNAKKLIPWRSMACSAPLLVVLYTSVIANMMVVMILVYIPVYFKDVLLLEVTQNGFYTAVPHLCNLVSKLFWGFLMDNLKRKKTLTATQAVKLSQVLSMLVISACFLMLAYGVKCTSHGLALLLMCGIGTAFGLSISGFVTSFLSLAPNFIGIISSVVQIVGFGGRMATPEIITHFKTIGTSEEWRGILLVYSVMTMLSAVLFFIWGSGEVQPWNSCKRKEVKLDGLQSDCKTLVDSEVQAQPQ